MVDIPPSTGSSAPSSPHVYLSDFTKGFVADLAKKNIEQEAKSAMVGTGTNLMIPGLLHTAPGIEHVNSGDVLGPPEAFFPFRSIGPDGLVVTTDADFDMDDNDDSEGLLKFEDFIDFGDDSSDDDAGTIGTNPLSPSSTEAKASAAPIAKAASNPTQALLDHFDRTDVITAFRRNQNRHNAEMRRTNINPAPHALKGPRLGAFSISPKSPIKSTIQQRKEKMNAFKAHSTTYLGVPAKKRVQNTHRRVRSS